MTYNRKHVVYINHRHKYSKYCLVVKIILIIIPLPHAPTSYTSKNKHTDFIHSYANDKRMTFSNERARCVSLLVHATRAYAPYTEAIQIFFRVLHTR